MHTVTKATNPEILQEPEPDREISTCQDNTNMLLQQLIAEHDPANMEVSETMPQGNIKVGFYKFENFRTVQTKIGGISKENKRYIFSIIDEQGQEAEYWTTQSMQKLLHAINENEVLKFRLLEGQWIYQHKEKMKLDNKNAKIMYNLFDLESIRKSEPIKYNTLKQLFF